VTSPDVAIVLDHFGSGGVERVACHVANGLAARGFCVEVVVVEDRGPVRQLLHDDVSVVPIGGARFLPRKLRLLFSVPKLAAYIRNRAPALVHSPGNHTHLATALALAASGGPARFLPKITNPIIKEGSKPLRRFLRGRLCRWILRRASGIIVLSPAAIDLVSAIAPEVRERTRFLHNPYLRLDAGEAETRRPADPPVILSVGRLTRQKDHATLLQAAALIADRDWRLRLFGCGPQEAALKRQARELGIEHKVTFEGYLKDICSEYDKATVLVLSSRWEELPAVVIEAMARGCPVVSTASSMSIVCLLNQLGAREPTAVGDPSALAQSLRAALESQCAPVKIERLRPYEIDAACTEHAQFFAQILGWPAGERRPLG
jgi:glycosyltransferase involved in cell wall biosynthesis